MHKRLKSYGKIIDANDNLFLTLILTVATGDPSFDHNTSSYYYLQNCYHLVYHSLRGVLSGLESKT